MLLRHFLSDVLGQGSDDSPDESREDWEDLDVPESFVGTCVLVHFGDHDFPDGEKSMAYSCGHGASKNPVRELLDELN